ncbi:apoptosis regulator BAX-like [Narcine bancroftii]|uniref:apoptosis regulator BAX-like n=1 Tax=Narcine bancroftii TaxID=1343680 RepID=UPI00383180B9
MHELSVQTEIIVDHLFEQDPESLLETDSGGSSPPACRQDDEIIKVAQCLRKVGDEYNEIIQQQMKKLQPKFNDLVKDQVDHVFSGMVAELTNNPELQIHLQQLGHEMHLLRAAVALGINISKEMPDLLPTIKTALTSFINKNLLTWIQSSGGWDKLL